MNCKKTTSIMKKVRYIDVEIKMNSSKALLTLYRLNYDIVINNFLSLLLKFFISIGLFLMSPVSDIRRFEGFWNSRKYSLLWEEAEAYKREDFESELII